MVLTSVPCKAIMAGDAHGEVLFSRSPISFIGGVDPKTGMIMDPLSDQFQQSIADKIFVFPFGKGSSGAGLVLLELCRIGKAPKAMVNLRTSTVLLTGPLVIREFYKQEMPLMNVDEAGMDALSTASMVTIQGSGKETCILIEKTL